MLTSRGDSFVVRDVDANRGVLPRVACDQPAGDPCLDLVLDVAPQRPGAEHRVEALAGDPLTGGGADVERDLPVGEAAQTPALKLSEELRAAGFMVELGYRGNLKRRMTRANKLNARAAVILGEDELAQASATVRDLDTGEQALVTLGALKDRLARYA